MIYIKYYLYSDCKTPMPNCATHIIIKLNKIDSTESIIPMVANISFLYFCITMPPHIIPGITAIHIKNDNKPQSNEIIERILYVP